MTMDPDDRLNIDEALALQLYGMPVAEIRETDCHQFDVMMFFYDGLQEHVDVAIDILERQEEIGIVSLSCQHDFFPRRLLEIGDDCPPVIHCKGNLELLNAEKTVAIIGARAADKEGYDKAYELGRRYAEEGYVVVSGLALGCDKAAHEGCLSVGSKTIAIVGNGLDICHPKENKDLEQAILDNHGLLLSEWYIRVKANPTRLVARNRLQAAMSDAVILAQCPIKSGSLHTMRFARQYNKQCLAATFPHRTEANAGNYDLLDRGLCRALPEG